MFTGNSTAKKRLFGAVCFIILFVAIFSGLRMQTAFAMPFYGLKPAQKIVQRASFYTSYSKSSDERKFNIALASKAINGTLLDVGQEFSFNHVVGVRTEKRGYKTAKIIVGGEFVDGVGGGVCQVSTTLYNAVLTAGLEILEYHPHSLLVSYVAPSFDAMVSGGGADLRFRNNTDNPIIIYMSADGTRVTASVFGEPMTCKYIRKSVETGVVKPPESKVIADEKGEFPDLYIGQTRVIRYAKNGLKSEGYLVKIVDGKAVATTKIRNDKYGAIGEIVVEGRAEIPISDEMPWDFG